MANGRTHLDIAIGVGLLLALFAARGHTLATLLAEAVGIVSGQRGVYKVSTAARKPGIRPSKPRCPDA